jgi:hypothetical protein
MFGSSIAEQGSLDQESSIPKFKRTLGSCACQEKSEQPKQCEYEPEPSVLVLHVLPAGVTRRAAPSGSLGFAVPSKPGEFGGFAGVFYDPVKRLSSRGFSEPVILGHAIAHELGHLLLGFEAHSNEGIMKAEWHGKELKRAENATLVFDPRQRSRIRQNLKTRLSAAHIPDHNP